MTALSIGRLTATLPEPLDEQGLATRAEDMLTDATGLRLEESLAARPLPPGHWFLRRLALQLPLDPRRAARQPSGSGPTRSPPRCTRR